MTTNGKCAGQVFEFDHNGDAFTRAADDLVDDVQRLLHRDRQAVANIASHMRLIDKNTGAQWWILKMNDNQGHRVRTDV